MRVSNLLLIIALSALVGSLAYVTGVAQEPKIQPKPITWSDFGDGWIQVQYNDEDRWMIFRSAQIRSIVVFDQDPLTQGTTLRAAYGTGEFRFDMLTKGRAVAFATFIAKHGEE